MVAFDSGAPPTSGPTFSTATTEAPSLLYGFAGRTPHLVDQALGAGTWCVVVDGVYDHGAVNVGDFHLTLRFDEPL